MTAARGGALRAAAAAALGLALASDVEAATLRVGAGEAYATIASALAAAGPGDVIEVHGGTHPAPLVVDRSVSLLGVDAPVLENRAAATAVVVTAPGVAIRGFVVRGSGDSLDQEHSGIAVDAPRATIEGNRIEDALFGIYLRKASASVIRGNEILAKKLPLARRGDAIRVWSSHDVVIEGNAVRDARDVVIWYSQRVTIRGNEILGGRYGLHFMYCDDALVEENVLSRNSVGSFLMYSRRLTLRRNRIVDNRGPSGYGVGLKDMDDAVLEDNWIADNRVGVYLDNSPREIDSTTRFRGNVLAWNDLGVQMQPSLRRNFFAGNSFHENGEQVSLTGGGVLEGNSWTSGGRGNYWSDYAGYDRDGDGAGDLPYRAERLFERLIDRHPELRLFRNAPAASAIDFAARAFPVVRPEPKLVDTAPLMAPAAPAGLPPGPEPRPLPFAAAAAGLLAFAGIVRLGPRAPVNGGERGTGQTETPAGPAIELRGVTRRFGRLRAVDDLSLEVRRGEAVAFWGRNGAGKTTALRCILGLLRFEGSVRVDGIDVRRSGKEARRRIGFVPQELGLHDDLTVVETLDFHSRLRGVRGGDFGPLLASVGLEGEARKRVRELSGGRKRLLTLALALLGDPPILLLDEPLSNLDAGARERFLRRLEDLRAAGKTLVFTTHRRHEVSRLADRVVVLADGARVAEGTPAEIASLLGGSPVLRIPLEAGAMTRAVAALAASGITAHPNGRALRVPVAAERKAAPLETLLAAGIRPEDFDLEWTEED